jgi:hypothetical protein
LIPPRRIELAAHSAKLLRLGQTTGRKKAEAHHQALAVEVARNIGWMASIAASPH